MIFKVQLITPEAGKICLLGINRGSASYA